MMPKHEKVFKKYEYFFIFLKEPLIQKQIINTCLIILIDKLLSLKYHLSTVNLNQVSYFFLFITYLQESAKKSKKKQINIIIEKLIGVIYKLNLLLIQG